MRVVVADLAADAEERVHGVLLLFLLVRCLPLHRGLDGGVGGCAYVHLGVTVRVGRLDHHLCRSPRSTAEARAPPFCCSTGRLRLRRAGSCRGGRPAWNATERAAPEHLNGHGSKDRTVSLTFERPSAAEIAREGASDALPGARLRPSRGEGYRKNCRCALRPENAVARAHLLGFGEIHARNARIVHDRRTSQPPRRVSPTCATACGVHRGVGRPNLTRCRLWRGWIRGLGTGSIETLGLCLLLKANSHRKGLVW